MMKRTEEGLTVTTPQTIATGRIVFTQGGKGGVGKTAFMSLLVDWYSRQEADYTLLDLDTENKARGSLAHFFPEARKVNIHTSEGLDGFVDALDHSPLVLADMGAGAGQVTAEWFAAMAGTVREMGATFTAIGVVTPDPASVESVCTWADGLQDRVSYLIVKNALTNPADFSYWNNGKQARQFREEFHPEVIEMEYRLPKVENPARQHGLTMSRIADRKAELSDVQQTTVVIRAQAYRRNLFGELDRVRNILL